MAGAKILCALIAAGMSTRFGGNKLEAMVEQTMLGTVAAQAMLDANLGDCIAVTRTETTALNEWLSSRGYRLITNESPHAGISHSIALAAHAAAKHNADALLICLADMPSLPVDSFRALAREFDQSSIVSTNGIARMPPAIFPRSLFAQLMTLVGDVGARQMLSAAAALHLPPKWLIDIDTRADLAQHLNSPLQK